MAKLSRHLTAFTTLFGLFQFRVIPFSLQGVPATFQRLMEKVLQGLEDYAAAYIDDLVIHSATWEEHLTQIQTVLQCLQSAGLTAKPQNIETSTVFPGHDWHYRKFIPDYANILTDLTKNAAPNQVVWTEKCEGSFQNLKSLLCVEPVLRSPDFTKEFLLQTDTSDVGVGTVLSQLDEEGADHPEAYYSRKLLAK
ncbi:hypothetical protein EMCRGX_G006985 [Ephydatia muelleri]